MTTNEPFTRFSKLYFMLKNTKHQVRSYTVCIQQRLISKMRVSPREIHVISRVGGMYAQFNGKNFHLSLLLQRQIS